MKFYYIRMKTAERWLATRSRPSCLDNLFELESVAEIYEKTADPNDVLIPAIFYTQVGTDLHGILCTKMSLGWVRNQFKEALPSMTPKTDYNISNNCLDEDQIFALKYQGDSFESRGAWSPLGRFGRGNGIFDMATAYEAKVMTLFNVLGLVDRVSGVWMREGPPGLAGPLEAPSTREHLHEFRESGVMKAGYGPYTPEEEHIMRSRLLLDENGKFKRMSYDEYLHHCYWGYRQIAGDNVRLPSVVKKQGGQSQFANTFVKVPRDDVPLATAFLSSMGS